MTESAEIDTEPYVRIGNARLEQIVIYASKIVEAFVNYPGNPKPERKGGYLTIRDRISGIVLLVALIGGCSADKVNDYLVFSQEKGWRLFLNYGHLSSFQTRNENEKKWAGAIVAGNYIISFSGLPELGDEAVMIVLASKLGWLDSETAKAIVAISSNPFFPTEIGNEVSSRFYLP